MDSYQAIYDAVRSKISNGDIGEAVQSAIHDASLSHYVERASSAVQESVQESASEYMRPSVMFRPSLSIDGDKWLALYGENIQEGVAGFGVSPSDAMHDFDKAWHTNLTRKE